MVLSVYQLRTFNEFKWINSDQNSTQILSLASILALSNIHSIGQSFERGWPTTIEYKMKWNSNTSHISIDCEHNFEWQLLILSFGLNITTNDFLSCHNRWSIIQINAVNFWTAIIKAMDRGHLLNLLEKCETKRIINAMSILQPTHGISPQLRIQADEHRAIKIV